MGRCANRWRCPCRRAPVLDTNHDGQLGPRLGYAFGPRWRLTRGRRMAPHGRFWAYGIHRHLAVAGFTATRLCCAFNQSRASATRTDGTSDQNAATRRRRLCTRAHRRQRCRRRNIKKFARDAATRYVCVVMHYFAGDVTHRLMRHALLPYCLVMLTVVACQSSEVDRNVGARCASTAECNQQCLGPSAAYPDGFCSIACTSTLDCPAGTLCVEGGVCMFECGANTACEFLGAGWTCQARAGHPTGKVNVCFGQ